MKENKWGIRITLWVAVISLLLTFLPQFKNIDGNFWFVIWIANFSFAVFGSALVTMIICFVSYNITKARMVSEVSRHLYTLANTYRLLIDNVQSQREIVINDFCNEMNSFMNCCERNYDNSRGMFCLTKKEKIFSKTIIDLSERIANLDSRYKYCISSLLSDLRNNRSTEASIEYFKKQVKISLQHILMDIVKIENAFYSGKVLKHKIELRMHFKVEFEGLTK